MSVQWEGYEPYHPLFPVPSNELSRKDARAEFDQLIGNKQVRIEALGQLLRLNGVRLGKDDGSLQEINAWVDANAELEPDNDDRLRSIWYAVTNDVALFLGEIIIERFPNLHWELFVRGARDVSYHRPVLMGFTKAQNPKYNIDIAQAVAVHLVRVANGLEADEHFFVQLVNSMARFA